MITANTIRTIDYAVLSVSGVCVVACLAAAAYAAPWTKRMREARASKQFNRLWLARMCMSVAAALWLLWGLLRMLALWGVRSRPGRASNLTSENLCRIYLAFSFGLLQPFFFLLALLLCHSSLSPKRKPATYERSSEGLLWLAAAGTFPVLVVQVVLAWFSKIFKNKDWEHTGDSLPRYFFGVYYQGNAEQCANDAPGCIVCIYPAATVIVTGIFCCAFLLGLCIISSRLAATAINRRLLRRMRTLQFGMDVLVIASLALLGASVSTNPFNLVWQILVILYSACACAMALLAAWLLVAVPVWVAKSADKLALVTWYEDSDLETALGGGGGGGSALPQEMALLDERGLLVETRGRGMLSDDASSSHGGSDAGGTAGLAGPHRRAGSGAGDAESASSSGTGSKRSLLKPGGLSSSSNLV